MAKSLHKLAVDLLKEGYPEHLGIVIPYLTDHRRVSMKINRFYWSFCEPYCGISSTKQKVLFLMWRNTEDNDMDIILNQFCTKTG
ncbi:hypothetical protein Spirs_2546 [Sediminispirochaeta smaragdinae DSM 11293]|uniref:Uncharacterized protein n=1 Tax=Sediminispirochaeta smaragdinae (strain DSM 11293 / JCM 15392 / SEBR 4228) TaxID=573413 RepID=E1R4B7_SEDSS|nr:hypothetical protein Spirs_2546 [Sediminispirochaeta smaragdinae DSM 11293]